MTTDREQVADIIRPLLPEHWRDHIKHHTVRNIGTLSAPSVFIDFTTITHDQMPPGSVLDGFDITLVSHLTDYEKAEDDLDAAARAFVRGLDGHELVAWSRADKRGIGDYLAWVVTVQFLTSTVPA